jgi:TonB family protein
MKIALVTAFPPSRQGLNEYGFHVADELRQRPGLELTVLGDYLPEPLPELPGFSVIRCWGFNRLGNPLSLLRAIRVLAMIVGPDGRPHDIRIQRGLGMGLDQKAIEAVQRWRFEPATKDGQPVAVQISVEVSFKLY